MTVFGDAEPENAWHPDDPVPELVDNVARRLAELGEPLTGRDYGDPAQYVAELYERVGRLQRDRSRMTDVDRVRLDLAVDDLDWLTDRIIDADG